MGAVNKKNGPWLFRAGKWGLLAGSTQMNWFLEMLPSHCAYIMSLVPHFCFAVIPRPWLRFHSSSWLSQAPPPHHVTSTLFKACMMIPTSLMKVKWQVKGHAGKEGAELGTECRSSDFQIQHFFLLPHSTAHTSGFLSIPSYLHFLFLSFSSHYLDLSHSYSFFLKSFFTWTIF